MTINNSKHISIKTLKNLSVVIFACFLSACGDSELPASESITSDTPEKAVSTGKPNPHTVQGMKKVMDDARGVEDLLQKQHEEQREEINNIR